MESLSEAIQENLVSPGLPLRMSDLISALSLALDLTEGQPMGHAVKSCLLGMRMAGILKLPVEERSDLYYALLLKDAGCSSNAARMYEIFGGDERAAKKEVKTTDWSKITFDGLEYLMRNVMAGKLRLDRGDCHSAHRDQAQGAIDRAFFASLRARRTDRAKNRFFPGHGASHLQPGRALGWERLSPRVERGGDSSFVSDHECLPNTRSLRRDERSGGRACGDQGEERCVVRSGSCPRL